MLNLSKSFRQQYGVMSVSEQFALGYFLENAEDNVHFRYRGNEWIADQIFLGFWDEFLRLSELTTLHRGAYVDTGVMKEASKGPGKDE